MAYCSPDKIDHYKEYKSCFDKETLIRIADSWNRFHIKNQIMNTRKISHRKLWNEINDRFMPICGRGKEVCWIDKLNLKNESRIKSALRPEMPSEWVNNPHTWLTNFNIEDVMKQYENAYSNFKFLGVYPVDFRSQAYNTDNTCLYQETCSIDMKKDLEKGIQYIGMIVNLDKYNESGSHWVALFMCIDPNEKCFGTYFYDSYAGPPPTEVQDFMNDMEKQGNSFAKTLKVRRKFKNEYNHKRHQYGNSECGMFSMVFIVRWLSFLEKNNATTLTDIVSPKITDEDVFKLRELFFRPRVKGNKSIINQ